MAVKNLNIAGLHARILVFVNEINKSVSASTGSFRAPDELRLSQYLNALKSYKKWVMDQDPIDAPHWHDRSIETKPFPVLPQSENTAVVDVLLMLELLDVELLNSQSKDLPMGLNVFDSIRFDQQLGQVEAFLADYIQAATPLDLPEAASDEAKK